MGVLIDSSLLRVAKVGVVAESTMGERSSEG